MGNLICVPAGKKKRGAEDSDAQMTRSLAGLPMSKSKKKRTTDSSQQVTEVELAQQFKRESASEFSTMNEDSLYNVFSFLKPGELLQAALVSKNWRELVDHTAQNHLNETQNNHSVSHDWKERLDMNYLKAQEQESKSMENGANSMRLTSGASTFRSPPPSRCVWKIAQELPLNQFEIPWGDARCVPYVLGLPMPPKENNSMGGSNSMGTAIAMILPSDGVLRVLDTEMGSWTCYHPDTGEAFPMPIGLNVDDPNAAFTGMPTYCQMRTYRDSGRNDDYLVYYSRTCRPKFDGPDFVERSHYFSVWRIISGTNKKHGFQFLHRTNLEGLQPKTATSAYHLLVKDDVVILQFEKSISNDDVENNFSMMHQDIRDDLMLDDSVMTRLGIDYSIEYRECLEYRLYDLKTGVALPTPVKSECTHIIEKRHYFEKFEETDLLKRRAIYSNQTRHWIENGHRHPEILIHEVDKTSNGQPVTRILRTGKYHSTWYEGFDQIIVSSKDELISYLHVNDGRFLQTFLL